MLSQLETTMVSSNIMLARQAVRVPMVLERRNVKEMTVLAKRAARRSREVCGLLVDHGTHVRMVQTRNKSRRPGSFWIHGGDWRKIENAAVVLGSRLIGTFHSHIVSPPVPGKGDIRGAINGQTMVIFDGLTGDLRAWRIRRNRAHRLKHEVRSFAG
jgi:proteasome lid subunit RPN8/RPN11